MLIAWCGPGGGGLFAGLFLAGLAGSPMHCGPMCGPFVLGQTADRVAALPLSRMCEFSRLRAGLLAPYHAGRLMTYGGLGALAGAAGGLPFGGRVGGAMLLVGALLFLARGCGRLLPRTWRMPALVRPPARWTAMIRHFAGHAARQRNAGGFLLGLVLGFLPCGFLYTGLAIAAATGESGRGAAAMLAFGAGTVPALLAVAWLGQATASLWTRRFAAFGPAIMLANAAMLAAAGVMALAG